MAHPREGNRRRIWFSFADMNRVEKFLMVFFSIMFIIGVVSVSYRPVASLISHFLNDGNVEVIKSTVADTPDPEKQKSLEQAELYNEALADGTLRKKIESGAVLPYEKQLALRQPVSIMAYIEIPSLGVSAPIYHGTRDEELASGTGHFETSSLPVGGPSSHCVISAHSGMNGNTVFNDIERMRDGDEFVIWTLGVPHAYRMIGRSIVLPNDLSDIAIEPGKDLCTLVTCTPKNINSHRLLVKAESCEYRPEMSEEPVTSKNNVAAVLIMTFLMIALLSLAYVLLNRRARRRLGEDAAGAAGHVGPGAGASGASARGSGADAPGDGGDAADAGPEPGEPHLGRFSGLSDDDVRQIGELMAAQRRSDDG